MALPNPALGRGESVAMTDESNSNLPPEIRKLLKGAFLGA
jgi:hypothetical protein